MGKSNYGFTALNKNLNSGISGNSSNSTGGSDNSARVISIVLDETHPRFVELGGWTALGAIEYDLASSPNYGGGPYKVAYPLNTNIKHFPLKNEIVSIISAFNTSTNLFENNINISAGKTKKYYTNIVNIWNHPHHNGYSFNISGTPPSQNKSYSQVEAGSESIIIDEPISINLGKTFRERGDIYPLLPFEGDIIYEGRWGNSIRLGSTILANTSSLNNWSSNGVGQNGDPIMIIRNGQLNITGEDINDINGSTPTIEDINKDLSSIYLTSTQKIPLKASSTSYVSYNNTIPIPINPEEYYGSQILLNSGRLVLNSKLDHILLSSARSINLNSLYSVNIDTKKFITQADKIFLGKEELATEPLLLGDTTAQLLRDLISSIKELTTTLNTLTSLPVAPFTPAVFPTLTISATKTLVVLESLEAQLGSTKENCTITSKRNFTL